LLPGYIKSTRTAITPGEKATGYFERKNSTGNEKLMDATGRNTGNMDYGAGIAKIKKETAFNSSL